MGWTYTVDELAQVIGADAPKSSASFHQVSIDTRTLEAGDVFFALSGENFDGNKFVDEAFKRGAAAAVTTAPFEGGPCLVVEDPLAALQAFARWHREHFSIPVIAITGSCGKTTSKDLLAELLATRYSVVKTPGNLNNEIGLPLSLLNIDDETEAAIVEMGANHGGEIAKLCTIAEPTEAAITMIAEAHLEGFGTVEDVAKAKAEIVAGLPDSGVFYVNADDPRCARIAESFSGHKISFGREGDVKLESCALNAHGELDLRINAIGELVLPLFATAHVPNVLLAIAIGLQHGVVSFEEPLRRACGQAARFNLFSLGPIEVIDDTYNANPASMKAALEALQDRAVEGVRIAALGDMLELGEQAETLHENLGGVAAACGIEHLYLRGDFAEAVARGARLGRIPHVEIISDHSEMAKAIASKAEQGDVLLVKGSRGMTMEKVIDGLRGELENPAKRRAVSNGAGGI